MAGLELNYTTMQECIRKLQELPANFPGEKRPSAAGAGEGIEEIEKMADVYELFYKSLEQLTEDTAAYLKRMAAEFKETDEKRGKAAKG